MLSSYNIIHMQRYESQVICVQNGETVLQCRAWCPEKTLPSHFEFQLNSNVIYSRSQTERLGAFPRSVRFS